MLDLLSKAIIDDIHERHYNEHRMRFIVMTYRLSNL
jgi:hypothetical protein